MKSKDVNWAVQLPGEMIQDIVEDYFNKEMYKREIVITDSKPSNDGYTFIVEYKSEIKLEEKPTPITKARKANEG